MMMVLVGDIDGEKSVCRDRNKTFSQGSQYCFPNEDVGAGQLLRVHFLKVMFEVTFTTSVETS